MANINIYGTLFSNLSERNDKVIVLGSQVYGNKPDQSSTATPIYTESNAQGWSSGLVMGNQYDINKFFKAELTSISTNISNNYVPYSGAGKNVNLGSHTITSAGFTLSTGTHNSAITDSTTIINNDSSIRLLVDTVDGKNQINLAGLYRTVKLMVDNANGTTGWAYTLYDHFHNLYDKLTRVVPYTGATTNVALGSHTITSAGFTLSTGTHNSAITDSTTIINNDSSIRLLVDTVDGKNQINLAGLYRTVKLMVDNANGTTGWAHTLYDHFHNLYDKVNHITNPLRFKGVINTGGKLPGLNEGVEVGDVWHFNADVSPYYGGDEVVCTTVSPTSITWELLGQNITPIPDSKITFAELEKP